MMFSFLVKLFPAAFTDDNLDGGEYFVPGTTLGGANGTTDPFWKQVKEWRGGRISASDFCNDTVLYFSRSTSYIMYRGSF